MNQTITRVLGRAQLNASKHGPRAAFIVGATSMVVGTALACRSTLRVEEKLNETQAHIKSVKILRDSAATKVSAEVGTHIHAGGVPSNFTPQSDETSVAVEFLENGYRRELARAYTLGAWELTKLYALPATLFVGGLVLVTGSHVVLTRRNAGLSLAYSGLATAFEEYRSRVREEVGEEREKELRYGDLEVVETEDGPVQAAKVNPNDFSVYARVFDETCKNWNKDPEVTRLFVLGVQRYMNDLLHARGHLFLNEVYDELGLERTTPGQHMGWIITDNPGPHDDLFVDFGILNTERSRAFLAGREPGILLDFNVHATPIIDKI